MISGRSVGLFIMMSWLLCVFCVTADVTVHLVAHVTAYIAMDLRVYE